MNCKTIQTLPGNYFKPRGCRSSAGFTAVCQFQEPNLSTNLGGGTGRGDQGASRSTGKLVYEERFEEASRSAGRSSME